VNIKNRGGFVSLVALPLQHILAELERIDLMIRLQVWHARQIQQVDEHFQGLYIADEEVDALLTEPAGLPRWALTDSPLAQADVRRVLSRMAEKIDAQAAAAARLGVTLPLARLAHLFSLSAREIDILLICLAPEIDLRYEKLYGYLQDDITKKRPTVDLALNLTSTDLADKLAGRHYFARTAPLIHHHLLALYDDPTTPQPPLLNKFLRVDARIADYLLGKFLYQENSQDVDARLARHAHCALPTTSLDELLLPAELVHNLQLLIADHLRQNTPLLLYLQGGYGVGKHSLAGALAHMTKHSMLTVSLKHLLEDDAPGFDLAVRLAMREAQLQEAVLLWEDFDALLGDERSRMRDSFVQSLETAPGITILTGRTLWEPAGALHDRPFVRIELPAPTYQQRKSLWTATLNGALSNNDAPELDTIAGKFRFTAGQIADAAATARHLAIRRNSEAVQVGIGDLYEACRLQSNRTLNDLARKIAPHYTWDDIVLPADRQELLREIVGQVKHRACVYEQWGFGHKLAMGKGLNVLFAGPSGTGKTMAAEIMANELGLDLYKIDLSTVVSKYIGETEKNLARIFAEAETSNAILFFDEADALFGRRSEVRDSHDRYANIEISYLLQRMEEYEGMAILATNLHKNMDEAFVRRMHFTVEFPFPDATHRRRIWEKLWPPETPCDHPLDLNFLAQRFEIAGGSIRNIVLAAAFLAADDGRVVTMEHLLQATQREYQKMGKVMIEGEFGKYAAFVM
jgi:AAA+ superfamily predicted ATPase